LKVAEEGDNRKKRVDFEHGHKSLAPTIKQTGDAVAINNSPHRSERVHEAPDTGIKQDVQSLDVCAIPGSSSGDTEKG
jgi:hypothetical protein